MHKIRLSAPSGDDVMAAAVQTRRKAGSGTRVEQQKAVHDQGSYSKLSQALVQKTGSSFFVAKH